MTSCQINGCGGQGAWFDPPDGPFREACNAHDAAYWIGLRGPVGRKMRQRVDKQFRLRMLRAAADQPTFLERTWYRGMAWIYWAAVRLFGARYFNSTRKRSYPELLETLRLRDYGAQPRKELR
jgi:hypothetical protein